MKITNKTSLKIIAIIAILSFFSYRQDASACSCGCNVFNVGTQSLFPNIAQAEDANTRLDFLSNGFKLRTTSTSWNNSGGNFIYLAFAENPVKYSNAR